MPDLTSAEHCSETSTVDAIKISTETLNTKHVTAGKLTEAGETFTLKAIEAKVSQKNGEFYVLHGELEDGRPIDIAFSSAKLHKLLSNNWDRLVTKRINISGVGSGYDREYTIQLVG
jgi:hypothetical protein